MRMVIFLLIGMQLLEGHALIPHVQSSCQYSFLRPHSLIDTTNSVYRPRSRALFASENSEYDEDSAISSNEQSSCWDPSLRRVVGSMASLGVLETAYLTYTKATGGQQAFCGPDGGCNSALTGPYSVIPYTDIPLAALGVAAYSLVALLALWPLIETTSTNNDDTDNRIWLTATTTMMGTFSVFLMSLLFGVLHASCPFCILSACLSIGMAGIVWIGGGLPDHGKQSVQTTAASFVTSIVAALVLFLSVDDTTSTTATQFAGTPGGADDTTLLASSEGYKPPAITTVSSERSLMLSTQLQALNARMYGAYWCSHCYDQKEAFGKEAFSKIPYIECSKDGYNQQNGLCKEKNVPGYPTWEINGKLYPGEQALEELEEIVQQAKK